MNPYDDIDDFLEIKNCVALCEALRAKDVLEVLSKGRMESVIGLLILKSSPSEFILYPKSSITILTFGAAFFLTTGVAMYLFAGTYLAGRRRAANQKPMANPRMIPDIKTAAKSTLYLMIYKPLKPSSDPAPSRADYRAPDIDVGIVLKAG